MPQPHSRLSLHSWLTLAAPSRALAPSFTHSHAAGLVSFMKNWEVHNCNLMAAPLAAHSLLSYVLYLQANHQLIQFQKNTPFHASRPYRLQWLLSEMTSHFCSLSIIFSVKAAPNSTQSCSALLSALSVPGIELLTSHFVCKACLILSPYSDLFVGRHNIFFSSL